jgi:hypothetical protein
LAMALFFVPSQKAYLSSPGYFGNYIIILAGYNKETGRKPESALNTSTSHGEFRKRGVPFLSGPCL